jgi:DNA-binding response OmpR family regulator
MPSLKPKRILLLEPDPVLRQLRAEILKTRGYVVYRAGSVNEGFALARANTLDLAIVGSTIDPALGTEFCDELKRHNPEQKVLAIAGRNSAYSEADTCPDDVARDGPQELVRQVAEIFGEASQ